MRAEETFFPGYRRETIIDGATILCNAAGEKRLKLSMRMPLSGDQLVGMPTWVGEPFADIAKPEHKVKAVISDQQLDPMLLHIFALQQSEKEIMLFDSVRMNSFKIERESNEENPPLVLSFAAYLPRTGKFLKFADDYFEGSIFIRFEAAQQSLLDDNPNEKPTAIAVMPPPPPPTNGSAVAAGAGDDDFEKQRKEAVSPALDPEFEFPKPTETTTKKPRGRAVPANVPAEAAAVN
jgi:hypothetical protein